MFWILLAILVSLIYFADKYYHNYWSRNGIFQKDTQFLFGELTETILGKASLGDIVTTTYNKFKNMHKAVGVYFTYRPVMIVNDPIMIQDIMIRDFNNFHNRGTQVDEKVNPLNAHLFTLEGQKWRDLRVKLSPTFTSGKLKNMFPTLRDCVKTLQDYMVKELYNGNDKFIMRDLMARYTTNVISSVAFGIDNDCINQPDNIFRKMGLKIFETDFKRIIFRTIGIFVPKLIVFLKLKIIPQDIEDFFMSIVKQTIDHRESNKGAERKDFMQLMIQLKNQGILSADKDDEQNEKVSNGNMRKLTFNEVAANAFLFFVAGFETSSSTMNFTLFELARNPDKQKKVQEELDRILDGKDISELTYDMVQEMKYLECCIDEALRIYPIVPVLNRQSTKEYTFASSGIKIENEVSIMIPVLGLHRDPEIYENPMEFRPERFLDSSHGNGKVPGLFYLPFGDGPRNCIGARMGKMQSKIGLVAALSKFDFELADKELIGKPLEFDKKQFIMTPKTEILYKITPRF